MPREPSSPATHDPQRASRRALAALFIVAGLGHFVAPHWYRTVMPDYLPAHDLLIAVSGGAEIAGGVGLLVPALRRAAGVGLMILLVAVFPANIEMLVDDRARGVPWWQEVTLWLRLPLQFVLIWWVARASRGVPPSVATARS
jgi:uncharacterized membrane protein